VWVELYITANLWLIVRQKIETSKLQSRSI